MNISRRKGTKIQMNCHSCRSSCRPQDGDWQDGLENQIFLCRACEARVIPAGKKIRIKAIAAPEVLRSSQYLR